MKMGTIASPWRYDAVAEVSVRKKNRSNGLEREKNPILKAA